MAANLYLHPSPLSLYSSLPRFASLFSSLLHAFSLNATLHDTSYFSIFLSLPTLPSHFLPLHLSSSIPVPSLSMLFYYSYNNIGPNIIELLLQLSTAIVVS